jgi:hypothetical protein
MPPARTCQRTHGGVLKFQARFRKGPGLCLPVRTGVETEDVSADESQWIARRKLFTEWQISKSRFMAILIVIVSLALAACIEPRTTSAPLSEPTVYEWIGSGPLPSLLRLAQDKSICYREAELLDPQAEAGIVSEHWKAHVKLCMRKEGWGEKAVK